MFANPVTGRPLNGCTLLKSYQRVLRRAGVRELRFHDLRHTFGTRIAAAGVPRYQEHAVAWLADRVERFARRVEVQPSGLEVRELGYRWGSCGRSDKIYFHWRSILLPPPIVEYIVVHDWCICANLTTHPTSGSE